MFKINWTHQSFSQESLTQGNKCSNVSSNKDVQSAYLYIVVLGAGELAVCEIDHLLLWAFIGGASLVLSDYKSRRDRVLYIFTTRKDRLA